MKYFVCFCYENEREERIEFGNAGIELEKAVTDYEDIREIERRLENRCGVSGHPLIMNYKPLDGTEFEYARVGDAESVRATGKGMIFTPNINISVSGENVMTSEEIAENLKKMLISQIKEYSGSNA